MRILNAISKFLFYNTIIRFILEGYLEFSLNTLINISTVNQNIKYLILNLDWMEKQIINTTCCNYFIFIFSNFELSFSHSNIFDKEIRWTLKRWYKSQIFLIIWKHQYQILGCSIVHYNICKQKTDICIDLCLFEEFTCGSDTNNVYYNST